MDDFRVNLVKNPGMMETKMAMESGVPTSMPEAVPVQPVANPPGTVMQCAYCDGDIEGKGISVSGSKVCSEVCADEIRRNPEDKLPDYKDLVIEEVEIEDSKVMIAPFTHAGVPMYFAFEDSNSGISEAGLFITYGPKSGYSFDDYCVGTAAQANHDAVDYEWIQKYADSGWIAEKMTEEQYNELGPYAEKILKKYKPKYESSMEEEIEYDDDNDYGAIPNPNHDHDDDDHDDDEPMTNPTHQCYSCSDMVHDVCRKCDCGDCCCDCNSRMLKNIAKLGGFAAIAGGLFWFIRSESE